jgi:hypothetical protein
MRPFQEFFGFRKTKSVENIVMEPGGVEACCSRPGSPARTEERTAKLVVRRLDELLGRLDERDRQILLIAAEQTAHSDSKEAS